MRADSFCGSCRKEGSTICGLVYSHGTTSVKELVWKQYEEQKSRGTAGFGVFDGHYVVKAATEKRIKRWFNRPSNTPTTLLFHHRWPTSTENVRRAAHPFHTGNYFGNTRYILAHNGVIRNSKELREKHEKLGITYSSVTQDGRFNDSEALLWDFALTMEKKQDKLQAYGDMAIICIRTKNNELDRLYFGRNYGRPLKMKRTKDSLFLSSEGDGTDIDGAQLYTYNYALNRLTHHYFRFSMYGDSERNYVPSPASTTFSLGRPYSDEGYYYNGCQYFDEYYIDQNGYIIYYEDEIEEDEGLLFALNEEDDDIPLEDDIALADALHHGINPSTEVVTENFYRLLRAAKGKYKIAYDSAIGEKYLYEYPEYGKPTSSDRYNIAILAAVIDKFCRDENYVDDNSVHPLWEMFPDEKPSSVALIPVKGAV